MGQAESAAGAGRVALLAVLTRELEEASARGELEEASARGELEEASARGELEEASARGDLKAARTLHRALGELLTWAPAS